MLPSFFKDAHAAKHDPCKFFHMSNLQEFTRNFDQNVIICIVINKLLVVNIKIMLTEAVFVTDFSPKGNFYAISVNLKMKLLN